MEGKVAIVTASSNFDFDSSISGADWGVIQEDNGVQAGSPSSPLAPSPPPSPTPHYSGAAAAQVGLSFTPTHPGPGWIRLLRCSCLPY